MRTKLDRQIETINRLQGKLLHAYRWAKKEGHTFQWILDHNDEFVWKNERFVSLPRWAKSHVYGYQKALLDMNYQNLELAHIYDGEFTLALPYGPEFDQNKVEDTFHVWKGTEKRF